tara:strand:+ start:52 stop:399 length:348 start_codon:yes stop_codon:yes gene_type:complete
MTLINFPTAFVPLNNFRIQRNPQINVVQFGDGYQQRLSEGLHTNPVSVSLEFNLSKAQAKDLLDFLDLRITNSEAFNFLIPNESSTRKFICLSYPAQFPFHSRVRIRCKFEEVFE